MEDLSNLFVLICMGLVHMPCPSVPFFIGFDIHNAANAVHPSVASEQSRWQYLSAESPAATSCPLLPIATDHVLALQLKQVS